MSRTSDLPTASTAEARALGRSLRGEGRLDEAVETFQGALARAPGSAELHNDLAVVLRELGRLEEAEAHFRRAAGLAPGFAPYHANLGQTLMLRGRAAEAAESFGRATRLAPGHGAFFRVLGGALEALDRLGEAEAAYREAVRLAPGLAEAHHALGAILVRTGRIREALAPLERAAALEPANPIHWENLAARHELAERFTLAIDAWRRVLELAPDDRAYPHLALGRALRAEGRPEEAAAEFRAAMAIEPHSAEPGLDLGSLDEERGDFAAAEAAYRGALAIDPDSSLGHARLAWLLRGRLPEPDLEALEARADDPDPEARVRLLYSLATALDARGDRARAVARLREANALQLETNRSRGLGFDPAARDRFVADLIAAFDPAFFARVAGAGLATRRPVFVVGLPRSGTTLIEQVLAAHPEVHGAGELNLALFAFADLPAALGMPGASAREWLPRLDAPAIRATAGGHLERLRLRDGGRAARVVDKLPGNYLYLGFLAALFPEATFIHCRRDLRDTALSCWMTVFQSLPWTNTPTDIASVFRAYLRLMDHWRATLPATIHEVDYEDTVTDLEAVARRLVSAMALEWDPACLEFHRAGRAVRTASAIQVREPVHRRSVGRWKLYETELADLFAALADVRPFETT